MPRRFRPRAAAVLIAVVSLVVMSGCVAIKDQTVQQVSQLGKVRITTTVCATQTDADADCAQATNQNDPATDGSSVQMLLAYRVRTGVIAPDTFTSTSTGPNNSASLTFSRSASYEAELSTLIPPPDGEMWVGYRSNDFVYHYDPNTAQNAQPTEQEYTVAPEFGLPQGADGSPFTGPFTYRTVAGWRYADATNPSELPDRPVHCGESPYNGGGPFGTTDCADSPLAADIPADESQPTTDAGILGGDAITASHGSIAHVPFTFRYVGDATGSGAFTLSASSPVGTATSSPATIAPTAAGDTPVTVSVPIGAGAAPGTYDVTLTAALANGQTRTQTRKVTVPGPPTLSAPPMLTGAERVGRTIKSSSGTWTSIAPLTFAYQWVRCQTNGSGCADIAGATASSYRLRAADAGRRVHVRVTASGADGSAAASSAPSGAVARPHVKPKLTITAPARMSLAAFLRGVRAKVRSDRAASLTVQLAAHATGAHISRAYNLVLATKRAKLAKRGTKTLRLRPSRKLVGSAQRFSVQLVVTARGAGGDVSTKRKRIRVR